MDASKRLAPLLSLCRPERHSSCFEHFESTSKRFRAMPTPNTWRPVVDDALTPDIARYFFSFPIRALPIFTSLVRSNDSRALMVLLYFYKGMWSLLANTRYWWAKPRAQQMVKAIQYHMEERGYGSMITTEEQALDGREAQQTSSKSPCFFHQLWLEKGFIWSSEETSAPLFNPSLLHRSPESVVSPSDPSEGMFYLRQNQ